jgi:hypothetical protein
LPPAFAGFLLGLFFNSEDDGDVSPKRRDLQSTGRYNPENHTLQT